MLYKIAIFLFTFLLYYHIYLMITKSRRQLLKRLETYTSEQDDQTEKAQFPFQEKTADNRGLRLGLKDLGKIFSRVDRLKGVRQYFDSELMKSGILLRGEEYLVVIVISAVLLAALGFVAIQSVLGIIFGSALGIYIPIVFLRIKKAKRQRLFNEQLGEVLTTMSNALRSGHSLLMALEVAANDSSEPAGQEFSNTVKEMQLGISTEEALKNLEKRIESRDLELMITAILIQRQVGGNLAEVLDSIADTIRDRLRIEGEIKTLTAQGRLSGFIIALLPVGLGLFFYMINPEYIMELFLDPIGIMMIVAAVAGQILGIFLIKKIVQIDV